MMKPIRIRRALLSLTDKAGAADFAEGLVRHGVEILSTGGTAELLRKRGIPVTDVAEVTGFPEIMNGRVKTLHPRIHGGILAKRDDEVHRAQMAEHGIGGIDLVAVNLYAFAEKAAEPGVSLEAAMESVDIGGPCMIRAAAKNHAYCVVVTDPADYEGILKEMDEGDGSLGGATRLRLARKAFDLTAAYDAGIQQFLLDREEKTRFPDRFTLPCSRGVVLRYGENPHQAAVFYPLERTREPCAARARQVGGKQLSFNNILDTDAAFELVKEFFEPAAVMIKHTNPCGAATAPDLVEAFRNAYAGDPVAAFGGIAALNRPVDEALAREIADPKKFLEVLIAPDCTPEALDILQRKVRWGKNLRILCTGSLEGEIRHKGEYAFRSVTGGILVQDRDLGVEEDPLEVVTEKDPDDETRSALRFAWKVVKHVKSNAIVLSKGAMLVGVGAGQMSRIEAARIAGKKAGDRAKGSVMASDAFFPFRDCVDLAAEMGVKAIIQTGGSRRDQESIDAANEHGIAMVFTRVRHFRH